MYVDRDQELQDNTLAEEIELLGEIMAAVAQVGQPLDVAELDRALGVDVGVPVR